MPNRTAELLTQAQAGQRCWKAPAETKNALVRFQRDVVLPLRELEARGAFRLREQAETYRGARFVVRIQIIGELKHEHSGQ